MISDRRTSSINTGKIVLRLNLEPRILLILLAICEHNIVRYFLLTLSLIPGVGYFTNYIVHIAYILLIIGCFQKYRIRVGLNEFFFVLFIVLSIAFTCILYPENTQYIFDKTNFWQTIFPCVRYFFVGLIFVADKDIMETIGKASCIGIIIECAFVVFYMAPRGLLTDDEMSRAYQLLPNVMFALCYAFDSKKIFGWICSIIGIAYIFAMGTRGPVIILLVYFIIKFLQVSSNKTWIKVLTVGIVASIGALFLSSNGYFLLLNFLKIQLSAVGLSTRVIDLAINGTVISHMAGRDELYEIGLRKIQERPLWGYGVYGEWPWIGWNIHNMYLEILIHFGVIIGLLFFIWIIVTIAKGYIGNTNRYAKDFIMLWVVFVFVRGLFGGSYLQYGMAILIGFCINESRRINAEKSYNSAE